LNWLRGLTTTYTEPPYTFRTLPSEGRGREFESRRVRHLFKGLACITH
jgi:hypothetical protein